MGILNAAIDAGLGLVGLDLGKKASQPPGPDFPNGLKFVEIVNGKEQQKDAVVLVGSFMPLVPFEFGGSQRVVKDFYPGNAEPVVQILGPEEDDVTIRGRFSTKRLKDPTLLKAAEEYQELVDAVRLRGNLVKITLGEWRRYGYVASAKFRLKRLTDIEYDITFSIVGFNAPSNCKMINDKDDNLIAPNKDITGRAAAALKAYKNYPASMPRTLSEFLNDQIGAVAGAINLVTDFVDGIFADVDSITASANRAVGLINNANAKISKYKRNLGAIARTPANLAANAGGAAKRTVAALENTAHINKAQLEIVDIQTLLARMKKQFANLAATIPMKRHLIQTGDSLQRLAMKYYQNADLWSKIYDHNKLKSTQLVVGTVLEIPRP